MLYPELNYKQILDAKYYLARKERLKFLRNTKKERQAEFIKAMAYLKERRNKLRKNTKEIEMIEL